jgi:hypothetical protein
MMAVDLPTRRLAFSTLIGGNSFQEMFKFQSLNDETLSVLKERGGVVTELIVNRLNGRWYMQNPNNRGAPLDGGICFRAHPLF